MKVRFGFVSNSSSSSYVICVARVVDEEELRKFLDEHKLDAEIYTTKEALEAEEWNKPVSKSGDASYFRCSSFDGNEVSIKMDLSKEEKFVSLHYGEDIEEDEDGPIEPDEIEDGGIYSLSEEHGVMDIQTAEGYGRNG